MSWLQNIVRKIKTVFGPSFLANGWKYVEIHRNDDNGRPHGDNTTEVGGIGINGDKE
jgi:hypothetical protein